MPDSTLKILRFGSCHFVMKDEIQNYEQIFLSFFMLYVDISKGGKCTPKKQTAWTEHCSHNIQEIVSGTKNSFESIYVYSLYNVSQPKMTGGTPEVRSDKSLTLLTFNI